MKMTYFDIKISAWSSKECYKGKFDTRSCLMRKNVLTFNTVIIECPDSSHLNLMRCNCKNKSPGTRHYNFFLLFSFFYLNTYIIFFCLTVYFIFVCIISFYDFMNLMNICSNLRLFPWISCFLCQLLFKNSSKPVIISSYLYYQYLAMPLCLQKIIYVRNKLLYNFYSAG